MTETVLRRTCALALVLSAGVLAGCVSSPTYGTGKKADVQLLEDLSGALSPLPKDRARIDYKPRPEIVKPGDEVATAGLPAPQDSVVTTNNPAWPESPEQRRARIRAEATAKRDSLEFDPEVAMDTTNRGIVSDAADGRGFNTKKPISEFSAAEEYKKRKKETQQGDAQVRKFLSEPPIEYREPAATAMAGDLGVDESKKEKQRKKAAKKKTSWADLVPWL